MEKAEVTILALRRLRSMVLLVSVSPGIRIYVHVLCARARVCVCVCVVDVVVVIALLPILDGVTSNYRVHSVSTVYELDIQRTVHRDIFL